MCIHTDITQTHSIFMSVYTYRYRSDSSVRTVVPSVVLRMKTILIAVVVITVVVQRVRSSGVTTNYHFTPPVCQVPPDTVDSERVHRS